MGQESFNRQFVMLDFEDLDKPEFLEFLRAPEFSTYLLMRRYVWRSEKKHSAGLDALYADGRLCCCLGRFRLAKDLGVDDRTVSRDIAHLLQRAVIEVIETGREPIYVLGKWQHIEGVYVEIFYLDRLCPRSADTLRRLDKNVQSDEFNVTGQKCPGRLDENVQADWTKVSTINREENKERIEGEDAISSPDNDIWARVLASLEPHFTRPTFNTWLKTTQGRMVNGHWEVFTPSPYARNWLEDRLTGLIQRVLSEIVGQPTEVVFTTGAKQ